jgi:hypothetical protein
MVSTRKSSRTSFADDPKEGSIDVRISHVRLSIAQKADTKTVPIPSILHKIMNKIRDTDCTAIFHDILDNPVSLVSFPVNKAIVDAAFGTIVPERRNSQVIVGFTIHSTMTIGTIKNSIMPTPQSRWGHLGRARCVRNSHTSGPRWGTNYLCRASCT